MKTVLVCPYCDGHATIEIMENESCTINSKIYQYKGKEEQTFEEWLNHVFARHDVRCNTCNAWLIDWSRKRTIEKWDAEVKNEE